MPGVYLLETKETLDELKKLLRVQKTASNKERIQLLYLLKSEQARTITIAASLLGRHRVTVQKWLSRYRTGGIENLLLFLNYVKLELYYGMILPTGDPQWRNTVNIFMRDRSAKQVFDEWLGEYYQNAVADLDYCQNQRKK